MSEADIPIRPKVGRRGSSGHPGHYQALGKAVRSFRLRRGMTQRDLSRGSGISESEISRLERGCRNPSLDVLCDIADALALSVSDLLKGVEDELNTCALGSRPTGQIGPGLVRVRISSRVLGAVRENAESILQALQTALEEATVRAPGGTAEPAEQVMARRAQLAQAQALLAQLQNASGSSLELEDSAEVLAEVVYLAIADLAENMAADAIYAWQDNVPLDSVQLGIDQLLELIALTRTIRPPQDTKPEAC